MRSTGAFSANASASAVGTRDVEAALGAGASTTSGPPAPGGPDRLGLFLQCFEGLVESAFEFSLLSEAAASSTLAAAPQPQPGPQLLDVVAKRYHEVLFPFLVAEGAGMPGGAGSRTAVGRRAAGRGEADFVERGDDRRARCIPQIGDTTHP